ncbi:YfbM family protein [Sphingobium boeckii]|nr:YfbM family protein [Sphingobium boeckii]
MILYLRRADAVEALASASEEDFADFIFDEIAGSAGDLIHFDKAWHALHFVFAGSEAATGTSLGLLMNEWPEFGVDGGYGAPRLAPPAAVKAFADALAGLSDEELKSRYDPAAMERADVYIADMLVEDGLEDGWGYVAQGLPALRAFIKKCVEHNSSVILYLS